MPVDERDLWKVRAGKHFSKPERKHRRPRDLEHFLGGWSSSRGIEGVGLAGSG